MQDFFKPEDLSTSSSSETQHCYKLEPTVAHALNRAKIMFKTF